MNYLFICMILAAVEIGLVVGEMFLQIRPKYPNTIYSLIQQRQEKVAAGTGCSLGTQLLPTKEGGAG